MGSLKAGSLTFGIKFEVSDSTLNTCIGIIEMYLDEHPDEELVIFCNEPNNWDIGIKGRKVGSDNE